MYISHCLTPMLFFRRSLLPGYMAFYLFFHSLSTGVAILFFGYIILWVSLVPVHRFFERVVISADASTHDRLFAHMRRLNWFSRVRFVESANSAAGVRATAGEAEYYAGADAVRRAAWGLPLCWPLLPLMYLPGLRTVGDWLFAVVTRER